MNMLIFIKYKDSYGSFSSIFTTSIVALQFCVFGMTPFSLTSGGMDSLIMLWEVNEIICLFYDITMSNEGVRFRHTSRKYYPKKVIRRVQ